MSDIRCLFPREDAAFWEEVCMAYQQITEIRLRVGQPIFVYLWGEEYMLTQAGKLTKDLNRAIKTKKHFLNQIFLHLCNDSPYAFEEEIKKGFFTVHQGHRVGVAGEACYENGQVKTIKNISALNIRISHEQQGIADGVLPYLYRNKRPVNTLIVSPPGCGKTTLLREIVRVYSTGNSIANGVTVGVVDERSEIAAATFGVSGYDLGPRTDVLDACPKYLGMEMLVRSMAPAVIAVDEIGGAGDLEALCKVQACGCSVLATKHGASFSDLSAEFADLFDVFLLLGRKEKHFSILKTEGRKEVYEDIYGLCSGNERLPGYGGMVPESFVGKNTGSEGTE